MNCLSFYGALEMQVKLGLRQPMNKRLNAVFRRETYVLLQAAKRCSLDIINVR